MAYSYLGNSTDDELKEDENDNPYSSIANINRSPSFDLPSPSISSASNPYMSYGNIQNSEPGLKDRFDQDYDNQRIFELAQAASVAAQGPRQISDPMSVFKHIASQREAFGKREDSAQERQRAVAKAIAKATQQESQFERTFGQKERSIAAKNALSGALQEDKQQAKEDKREQKSSENYGKFREKLDNFRGNTAAQQAAVKLQNAETALSLVKGKNPNELTSQDLRLMAAEIGKLATGGVPTQHEIESMIPKIYSGLWSEVKSFFNRKPTPLEAGEFVKHNVENIQHMVDVAKQTIQGYRSNILKGHRDQLSPEQYEEVLQDFPDLRQSSPETKMINGQNYMKVPGGWKKVN